jgi:predicted nucleic acid-binding protein
MRQGCADTGQVMDAEQIQAALTHDQHFAQAGFKTLLR